MSVLHHEAQEHRESEIDELYFGARKIRGKHGRGVARKPPVFDVLKHGGKMYVIIVNNCSTVQLYPLLWKGT
jgi:transposase